MTVVRPHWSPFGLTVVVFMQDQVSWPPIPWFRLKLTQVVPSLSPHSSVPSNPTFNLFDDRRDKQMVGRWAVDGFLLRLKPSLYSLNQKKKKQRLQWRGRKGGRLKPATKDLPCWGIFWYAKRSGGGEKNDLFIRLSFVLGNFSPLVLKEKGKRGKEWGGGGGWGVLLLHWKVIALFDSLLSAIQKQHC